jgi:hypothetical protein
MTVSGKVWGALSTQERQQIIVAIRNLPGFYRCTRLDLQITLTEPAVTALDVVEAVAAGNLWAFGYARSRAYSLKDHNGIHREPPTQYFGSPQSNIQARCYDKAHEAGWEVPAVRHEIQLRKEPADQHFRRLAARCAGDDCSSPLLLSAEALTVKQALAQHLDYRDTTRWGGRLKPAHWAKHAQTPEWWSEALEGASEPLQVAYKPAADLEATKEACVAQYGRKVALWALTDGTPQGNLIEAAVNLLSDFASRLKPEDWDAVIASWPEHRRAAAVAELQGLAQVGALRSEGLRSLLNLTPCDTPPPSNRGAVVTQP